MVSTLTVLLKSSRFEHFLMREPNTKMIRDFLIQPAPTSSGATQFGRQWKSMPATFV
jgi:hypothetical protein